MEAEAATHLARTPPCSADVGALLRSADRQYRKENVLRRRELLEKSDLEAQLQQCKVELSYYKQLSADLARRVAMLQECLARENGKTPPLLVGDFRSLKDILKELPLRRECHERVKSAKDVLKGYMDEYYATIDEKLPEFDGSTSRNSTSAREDVRKADSMVTNGLPTEAELAVTHKKVHSQNVTSLMCESHGKFGSILFSTSTDTTVKMWTPVDSAHSDAFFVVNTDDCRQEEHCCCSFPHASDVFTATYLPKKQILVTADRLSSLTSWTVPSHEACHAPDETPMPLSVTHNAHDGIISCLSTHPSESMLVSCGGDKTVRLWSVSEESQRSASECKLAAHNTLCTASLPCTICWMADNAFCVGSEERTTGRMDDVLEGGLIILDAERAMQTDVFTSTSVSCVRSHRQIPLVLAAHHSGAAGFSRAGSEVMKFDLKAFTSCCALTDAYVIALGTIDGAVYVYDFRYPSVPSGVMKVDAQSRQSSSLSSLVFGSGGKELYVAGCDGTVSIIHNIP